MSSGGNAPTKLMRPEDIPAFVQAVIATGCDITAVGHDRYVIGDADLPYDRAMAVLPVLREIERKFGERDHLKLEIVAHLRSTGRFLDSGTVH